MNILKYIFSKEYREKTKRHFSYKVTDRIDAADREIELIYKEILRSRKIAA